MSILSTLDRFVHATHLDILTPHGGRRPRNLRWMPLAILGALGVGYASLAATMHGAASWRIGTAGAFLFFGAFAAANLVRLFGPRLVPDPGQALDEREVTIKARAGSISGAILTILAILFCFYGGYASVYGTWLPAGALEWVYLGLGLQAAALALPVLVASWLQPNLDEEE
jgi:hypothetical protein